jgi:hypothetical protein
MFTDQDGDAMTAVDRFMGHQAIRFQLQEGLCGAHLLTLTRPSNC